MFRIFKQMHLFLAVVLITSFLCRKGDYNIYVSDKIERIELNIDFGASYCAPNGEIYAGDVSNGMIYRSIDEGVSWEKLFQVKNSEGPIRCVFVNQNGIIFISRDRSGELLRSDDHGNNFQQCLQLSNSSASTVWHMAENKAHWLFVAEYSNKLWEDNCAYLYRSKDEGKSWEVIYNNPHRARHFHFVAVDPYTDYIYAASGDGSDRARFIRSTDSGETWTTLGHESMNNEIDWQFTSIAFTPNYRILGEDDPKQSNIIRTADDIHFDKVFIPQGVEKHCFWAWGRVDSAGNIIFGSWPQHNYLDEAPQKGRGVIYLSQDEGTTWTKVIEFDLQKNHYGTHFASNVYKGEWIFHHESTQEKSYKLRVQKK